ncbi:MAG: hypothetical protein WC866_00655 [Patescibacteria group bacterium]|jgi:hypothetical protein
MANKTPREVVAEFAAQVCGKPPKTITPDEKTKILEKCVRYKIGRRRVGECLRDLGYKQELPARQQPQILKMIARAFKAAQNPKNRNELTLLKDKLLAEIEDATKTLGIAKPSWDHVLEIARGISGLPQWPRATGLPPGPLSDDELRKQLTDFMVRARTEKEVKKKYGDRGLALLAGLVQTPPAGFRMKDGRNEWQEKTLYLEQILGKRVVKVGKRVFEIRHSENDIDYVSVIFPQSLDFADSPEDNQIRILPIDTVWYGDHGCDLERFKEYLLYIERKPYVFAFLNGDIIGGSDYTKDTAVLRRAELKELLKPVAHKILWAQSGPLERRMRRVDGIEPLADVCNDLKIHHTDRPVGADVYWKIPTKPIEFVALHGRSQARKDGSKVNALQDIVVGNNFPHFVVLGHLQEGITKSFTVRRRDPVNLTILEHTTIGIVCPGFRKHRGSDAEKKGYPSPAMGTVGCLIGADNSHKAAS